MYNKVEEIIERLKNIEEKASRVGFNQDDAIQYTGLIKELKVVSDKNNLDSIELIKTLPLAKLDFTSLTLNS